MIPTISHLSKGERGEGEKRERGKERKEKKGYLKTHHDDERENVRDPEQHGVGQEGANPISMSR